MFLAKLQGGLGNQMFQYACARALAEEYQTELVLDLTWFDHQKLRKFELDQWQITPSKVINPEGIEKIKYALGVTKSSKDFQNRIRRYLSKHLAFPKWSWVNEIRSGHFQDISIRSGKNIYLSGYWQSEKYFSDFSDIIRHEFIPKIPFNESDQLLAEKMRTDPNSISIHVRRGDYIKDFKTARVHYVCIPPYYERAVQQLNRELSGDLSLYVFSDDISWCKNNLIFPFQVQYISGSTRGLAQEITLMAQARHQIISNSSFSWWAAWLNDYNEKIVVCPNRWFNTTPAPDILPKDWSRCQTTDDEDRKHFEIPFAKRRFEETFNRALPLNNPRTFNEKIQWYKIFYRDPKFISLVDKYAVREYIAEKIGDKYLNKLYGVYENVSDLEWERFPDRFVLKATHGSNWNIFCLDKATLNKKEIETQLDDWLNQNYYFISGEWAYKHIKPRIICEAYLEGAADLGLIDYKFYCFNGEPEYIQLDINRFSDHVQILYDMDWEVLSIDARTQGCGYEIGKPEDLLEMISIAKTLSEDIPVCRVDLYQSAQKIIFGELTLYTGNGFDKFTTDSLDKRFGDSFTLPSKKC
jgi:hypothetical protein